MRFSTRDIITKVVIVFLLIITTYQVAQILSDFIRDEKWTATIRPVRVDSLEFPTITLCNYNRVNKSKLLQLDITEQLLTQYALASGFPSNMTPTNGSMGLVDHFLAVLFESYFNSYTITPQTFGLDMKLGRAIYNSYLQKHTQFSNQVDLFDALALDCGSAYLCTFGGAPFGCCRSSSRTFTELGSCFSIQPPSSPGQERPIQATPGVRSGLQVYANAVIPEHVTTIMNNWLELGFQLQIDFNSDTLSSTIITLPVGFHTMVMLTRVLETTTDNSDISMFTSPCTDQSETKYLKLNYSLHSCITECLAMEVENVCGCIPIEVTRGKRTTFPHCTQDQLYDCAIPNVKSVWSDGASSPRFEELFHERTECRQACRTACKSVGVQMTSSLATAPSPVLAPAFTRIVGQKNGANIVDPNDLVSGYVVFDVYFKDMSYTEIENYPRTTFEQLLGSIGGVVGLWIGVSVYGIVEMIDSCLDKCQPRSKRSGRAPSTHLSNHTRQKSRPPKAPAATGSRSKTAAKQNKQSSRERLGFKGDIPPPRVMLY